MNQIDHTEFEKESILRLAAKREEFSRLKEWLESRGTAVSVSPAILKKLLIVSDEVFTNIASYAYPPASAGIVEISFQLEEDSIILTFSDSGIPFNPLTAEEPNLNTPLRERKSGGLGIFLIKKLMDSAEYCRRADGQNILVLTKRLS